MADSERKAKLTLQVDTPGIADSIARIKELGRADQLNGLVSAFERSVKSGVEVEKALEAVNDTLKKIGANDTEIEKVIEQIQSLGKSKPLADTSKNASLLQKELAKLSRTADLDQIAKEFGEVARQTDNAADAADELTKKLKAIGATDDEIRSAARAFEIERTRSFDSQSSGSSSGGGNAPAFAKFRGAASLLGGSGAGEIVGVFDDLQDAFEGVSQAASAAPGALASAASALGPVGLGLAAVAAVAAAAFVAASQSIQAEATRIDEVSKSRLSLSQRLPDLTQSQAQAELDRNAQVRENLLNDVATAEREYNEFLAAQPDILGNLGDNLLKVGDSREDALAKAVSDAKSAVQSIEADSQTLQDALTQGKVKADETAEAEQKLAEVRGTDTPAAIEKASKAEKEVQQAIEDTAKAQEKAAQEQEQIAEKTATAGKKYADAVAAAGESFVQAGQDIATGLQQSLADNLTSLFRDVDDIAQQFRQDTYDAQLDGFRAERDAQIEHERDIEDIIRDSKQSELEAIREGDFKALYLARQARDEELQTERRDTRREQTDRDRAAQDERDDLLRNAQRERADRLVNYDRQNADSRLNAQRELQQAQVNRQRSLEAAANAYRAELAQLGQYLQARNQMQAAANQQALQGMRASGSNFNPSQTIPGGGISGSGISGQGIPATMLQVIQR